MGSPLKGKEKIMEYSGYGETLLDVALKAARFPHFWINGILCSHTDAIDRWFIGHAERGTVIDVKIGVDDKRTEPGRKG